MSIPAVLEPESELGVGRNLLFINFLTLILETQFIFGPNKNALNMRLNRVSTIFLEEILEYIKAGLLNLSQYMKNVVGNNSFVCRL